MPASRQLSFHSFLFALTALLLFLAPLFRSGKTPLGLLFLELIALGLLLALLWRPARLPALRRGEWWLLGGLFALPLLHSLPLPAALPAWLPGREAYAQAEVLAARGAQGGWDSMALVASEAAASVLLLLLPAAVFLAVRALPVAQVRRLVQAFLLIALLQALLGLLQYGGADSLFYMGMQNTHFDSAVGTYTSRNNFVGLMYLALMLSLVMLMATVGRGPGRRAGNLRERLVFLASFQGHKAVLYGALSLLLLLAIIFSRSRGGIGVTMLGVVAVALLLSRRLGGGSGSGDKESEGSRFGLIGSLVAVALACAVSIGLAPVLQRFAATDPVSDGRWLIFDGTFEGIGQFFPWGIGTGGFQETFFPFQALEQSRYLINRAHNDYLEWLYDGGVLAALLVVCLLLAWAARWLLLWKPGQWGDFRYLQVGAGLGMALMLLHDGVDYNLFVPANIVFFAFFAGLFTYPYVEPPKAPKRRRRRESDPRSREAIAPPPQTANPFMEG